MNITNNRKIEQPVQVLGRIIEKEWPQNIAFLSEKPRNQAGVLPYTHPHPRLVICTRGRAKYQVRRSGRFGAIELESGQGVFIQPNAFLRVLEGDPYESAGLLLKDNSLEWFINDNNHGRMHRALLVMPYRRSELHKALEQLQESIGNDLLVQLYARISLVHLAEVLRSYKPPKGSFGKYLQAKGFVDKHFHLKINRKTVAHNFDISPDYLNTLFRRFADTTFSSYLTELRLHEAYHLLDTGMKVADAAQTVGFHSSSHLILQFKKRHGNTPGRHFRSLHQITI